jgi:hypothetical protein
MIKDMSPAKIPGTIRISQRTGERLADLGKFNETFDDVITRVLDEREALLKKKK